MKILKPKIQNPLTKAQRLANKKIIKQFAHKFDFAYLGRVSHQEEGHQLVRGVTSSISHIDDNFAVGAVQGYDITIVERQDIIIYPSKPPRSYSWLILQFDLKRGHLPHIFIEGNHHEDIFFANLFIKHSKFHNASNFFMQVDPLFVKKFKVFTAATAFLDLNKVLDDETTAMLAHHFDQFDYEIDDDRLMIYLNNPNLVVQNGLGEMLRIGVWLAKKLDSVEF